jgi:hypothetical protein
VLAWLGTTVQLAVEMLESYGITTRTLEMTKKGFVVHR